MQRLNKSQLEYVRDNVSPHMQNFVSTLTTKNNVGGGGCTYV